VFLMIDLQTGHVDAHLTLDSSGSNGLMGVTLIYNDKKQVVGAYAGDLKGNLWRIELSTGTPVVGFDGSSPLFKAISSVATGSVPQPITIAPTVYPHPLGGNLVLFGTGRLIDATDADSKAQQTFYGIWDKTLTGGTSVGGQSPFYGAFASNQQRTLLVQQSVGPASSDPNYFVVSSNPVTYPTQLGWYMDLDTVSSTQRVLYPSQLINDFVLINTVQPALPATDPCDASSGSSVYFLLPAISGASYQASPVWDVNGDGSIDQSNNGGTGSGGNTDTVMSGSDAVQAAGYRASGAGETTVMKMPDGDNTYDNLGPGGEKLFQTPKSCPGGVCSRVKQRVWQQLMTPPF
jgi:type IV pilus assembly protein PilY1